MTSGNVIEEPIIVTNIAVTNKDAIAKLAPHSPGKLVAFVASESSADIVKVMHRSPQGADARIIGRAVAEHPSMVLLRTGIGGTRILDLPFTEQLPRIR